MLMKEKVIFMFIDEVILNVIGGRGGDGVTSFRHENLLKWEDLMEVMEVTEVMLSLLEMRDLKH